MFRSDRDLVWRKSSASNNLCVEAASYGPGAVAVRDSKRPEQGFLLYDTAQWQEFLAGIKRGDFTPLSD